MPLDGLFRGNFTIYRPGAHPEASKALFLGELTLLGMREFFSLLPESVTRVFYPACDLYQG
jgi:hypothetical protein